jgi:hypothetical protein
MSYESTSHLADNIHELAKLMPERCRDCSKVGSITMFTALSVERGEITPEDAKKDVEERALDIERNCQGAKDKGGCFVGAQCRYKTITN